MNKKQRELIYVHIVKQKDILLDLGADFDNDEK